MNQPQALVRIGALVVAFLMTAVVVGGPLGLANHYAAQADSVLAAKQVAQRADCPAAPGTRS